MKTIFKYPINLNPYVNQEVWMPPDAQILTVQIQKNQPCIWALIDTDDIRAKAFQIEIFETGQEIEQENDVERRYLGTCQMDDGDYVFHVFERIDV